MIWLLRWQQEAVTEGTHVPESISNAGGVIHLCLQLLDLLVVLLQALADGLLEVIDLHKVWEERQDVLDVDQAARLPQQLIDALDALVLSHHHCARQIMPRPGTTQPWEKESCMIILTAMTC